MLLGIDFGTTRTLVAAADRGNYPVVSFEADDGTLAEHIPSVAANDGGHLVFGQHALAAAERGAPLLRSFKRALARADVRADTPVRIGDLEVGMGILLRGFLVHVRDQILEHSNAPGARKRGRNRELEVVVAVPAHAHAGQRLLTIDAFSQAGFTVRAVLNEPSAAGFEYTHRQAKTVSSKRGLVVVYDLGGGTFDASLVRVADAHHDVLATAGDARLGGDDFDEVLCEVALEALGRSDPSREERRAWLDACREAKERLRPTSRKLSIEVENEEVSVPVERFYAGVEPLIERSIAVMAPLLTRVDRMDGGSLEGASRDELSGIAGIYLVGGGSELPAIARVLRERFGRRVHRSPYPAASTAIGLAIAADTASGFTLTDRFSRNFGVFREEEGGNRVVFDAVVRRDVVVPHTGAAQVVRRYEPAHNVGHFRFAEVAEVDDEKHPIGELVPLGDVRFPFDPRLQHVRDLSEVMVERIDLDDACVEEHYKVDARGLVEVEIRDLRTGHSRVFRLRTAADLPKARKRA